MDDRWFRSARGKKIIFSAAIVPLVIYLSLMLLSAVTSSLSVQQQQATSLQTSNIELGRGTAYNFLGYGTFLTWNSTIYAQGLEDYLNQINFTSASYGNLSRPTLTFGLGSEYANSTITGIASHSLKLSTGSVGFGSSYSLVYFYFPSSEGSPALIYVNSTTGNTQISSSSFYTTYSQFQSSSPPSVYLNNSASLVQVKLGGPAALLFYYTPDTTTTSSSSASTTTSSSKTISITTTSTSSSTTSSSTTTTSSTTRSASSTTTSPTVTISSRISSTSTSSSSNHSSTTTISTTSLAGSSKASSQSNNTTSTNPTHTNLISFLSPGALTDGIVVYEAVLLAGLPGIAYYSRRNRSRGQLDGGWRW